eukprot:TRINITY_DN9143_c0_g1_i1.p1 TRINITY_DN9143_c0_g1~~TRINITY_DN9143_c0_g1_i1.p1  ORF type:complete len:754 (+),score=133.26 TRINITY_DN9143_c0_g1_i1:74-2263(+)
MSVSVPSQPPSRGSRSIGKVLVANRGEIALRVIRTCARLGVQTCAVYTTPDQHASFVTAATESYCLGGPAGYLDAQAIVQAAVRTACDAVHPGFGFLAENEQFAQLVTEAGLLFIGPSARAIGVMGSKVESKRLLSSAKYASLIPLIPGYHGESQLESTFLTEAKRIGFPVLLKASAGGGGKGMKIVWEEKEFAVAFASAKREGLENFGSDLLLIEKYFPSVRHIEFQIFGDSSGKVLHMFERDCSIQRRHQKVIEETPSPLMGPDAAGSALRERMGRAAVAIGEAISYTNAGTVEFIVDEHNDFYFLEVNTRLQVEHTITEEITGLDLVELQLRVSEGFELAQLGVTADSLAQRRHGHAIQCRLYAEDPLNQFLPTPGRLVHFTPAQVEGVRYDSGVQSNSEISIHYDPMVAKVIARGPTRAVALQRMRRALAETVIVGLCTNQAFLQLVLAQPIFQSGNYNTHFIQETLPPEVRATALTDAAHSRVEEAVVAATVFLYLHNVSTRPLQRHVTPHFRTVPASASVKTFRTSVGSESQQEEVKVEYKPHPLPFVPVEQRHLPVRETFTVRVGTTAEELLVSFNRGQLSGKPSPLPSGDLEASVRLTLGNLGRSYFVLYSPKSGQIAVHQPLFSQAVQLQVVPRFAAPATADSDVQGDVIFSPMAGKVVSIVAQVGDSVKKGDPVIVLESMKMETVLVAPRDGIVGEVLTQALSIVEARHPLVVLQSNEA